MVDILISIVAKVAEYTVAPIGRQLGYLFCYKQNVDDLNTQIDGLRRAKERLQHEVDEAKSNGRQIEADVSDWFTKADKIISEDHEDFTRHEEQANTKFTCGAKFPNLVLRHRLSRRAKKMAEKVATQIQDGNNFKQVSYRPSLPSLVGNKGYEGFESRNQTLTDVVEALRDPSVRMVGVWGMGGVGKTMLAKEVARRAEDEEKLFTKVVFTAISKDQNIEKIQQEIGEKLGMEFHIQSKDVRAALLRNRLEQENNLLIILDDIWNKLDLEDVGISQKECKILLTTRSYDVLVSDMDVDKNVIFHVGVLMEHEAMSLFYKIVGDQLAEKHDDFKRLAPQIVEECGRLPIAITTVASALKNKDYAVWKNALQELKNSNPSNIQGMHEKVYTGIKFSYDHLKSVEAKHLLLLCSLFPEDANIHMENELCKYGIGLNLFEGVNTLEEARNKMVTLVTNLKDHSLLLDSDYDDYVKLHDVIRDVVIFIASKLDDHHRMHNIRNADELEKYVNKEMFKDSTAISMYDIKADQYPQTLKIPELNFLRLVRSYGEEDSGKLPHQFFEVLNKLLVLDSVRVSLESLSTASSFCLFPNLQTLRLTECILGDTSWIGELKNLKILDLSFNSFITELPRGIGKLNRLLSLNLEGCHFLEVIERNVLSSLTRLEELNLKNSFKNWEVDGIINGDERRNANLSEVKNLPHLIDLNLEVPDINSVPKDMFNEQWKKYCISIGAVMYHFVKPTSRTLSLKLCPNSVLSEHDFEALLKTSEALYLNGFKSVKSLAFEIDCMGFKHLKHLTVEESIEIRCIVNSNNGNMDYRPAAFPSLESLVLRRLMSLENIIHGKLATETSFGKLTEIEVRNCEKLKSLFSLFNVPRQLKSINVTECTRMEEIITHHGREGDHFEKIEVSPLQSLRLAILPKLVQFIATRKSNEIKSEEQSIDYSIAALFNGQVLFPKLETLNIGSLNIRKIWNDNQLSFSRFGFQNLTKIDVWFCDHLKGLIPSFMTASLVHLRDLCVSRCQAMKEIVFIEESTQVMGNNTSFPKLQSLELNNLPNLETFCGEGCVDCPFLSTLTILRCPKLRITTEMEDENSRDLMDKHLSCHKDVVKVELSPESSCSEITCQPHPLASVEEQDDMVFKTKRLSDLLLWNFPNLQQLPKTFPRSVESLCIWEWDIRLKDLATPFMSFQNLKFLTVKDCHGLTSLLSPSTAKSLSQQLTKLGISGCKSLRQVIANDRKEAHDHEIIADNTNIIFSQLKCLVLHDLSSLTSFYSGDNNVILQFPHLDELYVGDCPEMKTFYHGNIDCPSLHAICHYLSYVDISNLMEYPNLILGYKSIEHSHWTGDINTTIQKLWEDKNIGDSPESEENAEEDHAVGP